MKKHPPAIAIPRAREMRRNPTDAEKTMWRLLRENFPEGRWRRQVPIRHYIADFASHRLKLVVETDGGQHDRENDAQRTRVIEAEGCRVVRFWNNDVLEYGEGCMIRLGQVVARVSPPSNCD